MKTDQLHVLLILFSCIAAYLLPFELFLFSYIILGALHYLTELAWLHEKKYFTSSAKTELIIIFLSAIIISFSYICYHLEIDLSGLIPFFKLTYGTHFIFLAFIMALSAVLLKSFKEKLAFFILSLLGVYLFRNQFYYLFVFGILLPTLIHVFIFTGIFMLVGIKKNPTFWTKICFTTFIICAISLFIVPVFTYSLSEKIKSTYILSGFNTLNKLLITIFDGTVFNKENEQLIFESSLSIKIQRFIAFAYTYHYLNWFLKVNTIAWHKVNKIRLSLAILLWIVALGIYFYDFKTGILTLYFLSILHVLMEFPLNIQSIRILIRR